MNEILKMVLEKKNSQEYKDYLEKGKRKKSERLIDFVNRKKIIEIANDFFLKELEGIYAFKIKPEEEKEFSELMDWFNNKYVKEHYRNLGYYLYGTKVHACRYVVVKLIGFEEAVENMKIDFFEEKKWWQIWK